MPPCIIDDPIGDPRWAALVERHPDATVFHSPAWLDALRQTYGFRPFVVTTSDGPVLENGIVVCRKRGFGSSRLQSLPFSDHCDPLVAGPRDAAELCAFLVKRTRWRPWGTVELRPRAISRSGIGRAIRECGLDPGHVYCLHRIDLNRDVAEVFAGFHHSSTQRAIRRAEREALTYDAGRSEGLLADFYRLLRMSRRRHGVPPQPMAWFRALAATFGDQFMVHLARKDGQPVAGMVTLSFRQTVVYKYGGSDAGQHALGGMPFLFWRVIQEAHAGGFVELDLGRSDFAQRGLVTFKDHLGAARSTLTYYRRPSRRRAVSGDGWLSRAGRGVLSRLPDSALDLAGRVMYRHLG